MKKYLNFSSKPLISGKNIAKIYLYLLSCCRQCRVKIENILLAFLQQNMCKFVVTVMLIYELRQKFCLCYSNLLFVTFVRVCKFITNLYWSY